MLLFTKGSTNDEMVVTLKEKTTLELPNYLFVFTNITTKEQVKFVRTSDDDFSVFQDRYNDFNVDTSTLFANNNPGQYLYKVYEQESTTNIDETLTGDEVENGKMNLLPETELQRTIYETTTTIKTYQG